MSFTRTISGISSYNEFLNVDYIVFSEGGRNIDPTDEAYSTDDDEKNWGIDAVFWRSVFSRFFPDIKCRIKPLGSKQNVLPYAEKIRNNQIRNSIATMDKDHDDHHGKLLNHPEIIYTHGYSWENDAWLEENVTSLLCKLAGESELKKDSAEEITNQYKNFSKNFKRLIYVDILCSLSQLSGIDRDKYWGLVDSSDPKNTKVKKERIKDLINKTKNQRKAKLRYTGSCKINTEKDCYGKLFSKFAYSIYCEHFQKTTGRKGIPADRAEEQLACHFEYSELNESVLAHYTDAAKKFREIRVRAR